MIYLASASPRRHEILLQMGVAHEVLRVPSPPGEDEPRLRDEPPDQYVRRTARDKALRARAWVHSKALPERTILSADTIVILDGDILGKPVDTLDAARTLARLSGRRHEVRTAVALEYKGLLLEDVSVTEVLMKILRPAEIRHYCESGEPMGKAGSYAIQGFAARFTERISGSHSGVMGLPVFETARLLETLNLPAD